MAVNAPTTAGPYFATGSISWSDLRQTFRAQNPDGTFNTDNNPISSSDLYRVTTTTLTNPIVPDCTENRNNISPGVGVPANGTYPISRIRNAIKYYFLTQTGNDQNLDLDATPNYNNNLARNIRKFLDIQGTVGSSNGNPAATFNAQSFNLTIRIANGANVFGFGGGGGPGEGRANNFGGQDNPQQPGDGQAGGAALSVNSASGNNNTVFLFPTSNVYGGGGGGDGGVNGTQSFSAQYQNQGSAQGVNCVPFGGGFFCTCNGSAGASCNATARGGTTAYTSQFTNSVGCSGFFGPNSCACDNCVGQFTTVTNINGNTGTIGRGFNNQGGSLVNGGNAGNGGDWGQAGGFNGNGGAAGAAVAGGTEFTLTGTINNTTVRGATI